MDLELKDKVALVTGASRGIGREIALALSEAGATVALNYHRDDRAAENVLNLIKEKGGQGVLCKVSVKDLHGVQEMVETIRESLGPIDVLVNNAGIVRDKLLMAMEPDDWREVIETNLMGVFNITKQVVFSMMRRRIGKIVNIASLSGVTGAPGQTNYTASKGGIISFTKSLARELAPLGINVNAVAPGLIETEMIQSLSQDYTEKVLEHIPLKRLGRARDVAHTVLFLVKEKSSYMTGQVIQVDGGLYM